MTHESLEVVQQVLFQDGYPKQEWIQASLQLQLQLVMFGVILQHAELAVSSQQKNNLQATTTMQYITKYILGEATG